MPKIKSDIEIARKAKMKSISKISITLKKGQLLFIPSYWWYSIQFNNSVVLVFKYKTYMNQLTILPEYLMSFMQRQNIKKKNQNKIYKADNSLKKEMIEVEGEKKDKNKEKKNKKLKKNKKKENEKNI